LAGGWKVIGYTAPNGGTTTNFEYTPGTAITENATVAVASATNAWNAKNLAKLNDCPSAINWTVSVAKEGDGGDVKFAAEMGATNKTNCIALTPAFEKIGK